MSGVQWANALVPASKGVNSVLYSFDEQLLVVSGPTAVGNDWVLLYFQAPNAARPFHFELLPGRALLHPRLTRIQKQIWLGVLEVASGAQGDIVLRGVRLGDLASKTLDPSTALRDLCLDGAVGGAYPAAEYADLYLPIGSRRPLLAEWRQKADIPADIVLPREISFSSRDRIVLMPCVQRFLLLSSIDTRVRDATKGMTPVHVYDRRTDAWSSMSIPGGQTGFRAFGEWLCATIGYRAAGRASPGADDRRTGPSPTGPGFDAYASDRDLFQPGLVWLYHVPTGRKVIAETGQGDTEVLWVSDERVLYRCDRALFEARVDGASLSGRRKLLERDFIADVHWVFYGPPSPPPLNPPWTPFPVE